MGEQRLMQEVQHWPLLQPQRLHNRQHAFDVTTGGTIAPLIVAIAAGATAQVAARSLVQGGFTWEQLPNDVVMGGANGLLAALTMPQAAARYTAGSVFGILRVAAENPILSGAAISALSGVLQRETWQEGFGVGILNIAQMSTTGSLFALGTSALLRIPGATVRGVQSSGLTTLTRTSATWLGTQTVSVFEAAMVRTVRLAGSICIASVESGKTLRSG